MDVRGNVPNTFGLQKKSFVLFKQYHTRKSAVVPEY